VTLIAVFWVLIGSILGLIMGALPGLTVTMTVVLIVSLTYGWPMLTALAFILGAFAGGVTGGALSAITMNIPGTAAAVATIFDGYPLNKRGESANAIGLVLAVGFLGAMFGVLFLVVLGPIISNFALKFGSQEYFLVTLWGLTLVAVLSKGKVAKGFIATALGLFIGMIGMDPITGIMRFTFGSRLLSGGINFVVAMIGLFGMKEVFSQLVHKQGFAAAQSRYNLKDLLPKPKLIGVSIKTFIWSAPIGAIIGLLPGTGGDVAALVSYGLSKQLIQKPSRPFGEGAYEGVASPEIANHAAMGGAITTALTLGIPGDSVTAVLLGSFYLHGLIPGPMFMATNPGYFNFIVWCLVIGIVFAYVFGLLGSNVMLKMLRLPQWFLIPFIALLCIVGSYALQNSVSDIILMIAFGLIGFAMDKSGYPVGCIILAIILGPLMELNFRQALINTGSMGGFFTSLVTRPISLVLIVLIGASLIFQAKIMMKAVGGAPAKAEK
jgi:putative tricarboxylic transport membrane protein